MPDVPLEGNQEGYAGKDEIADYLENFVNRFHLPTKLQTEVVRVYKDAEQFVIETNGETYRAHQVIAATGPFQKPFIPPIASTLSEEVTQVHSSLYHNPAQLRDGNVLVVGGGNSGAQISVELAQAGKPVTISIGHRLHFIPLRPLGKSIFWWFKRTGLLSASAHSAIGKWLQRRPDPIFGKELQVLLQTGVVQRKPRVAAVEGENIFFEGGQSSSYQNIVWATGFTSDFGWLHIPEALGSNGKPIHNRGVSPVKGLYFVGQPWQQTRGSALLGGVWEDANYIVNVINQ